MSDHYARLNQVACASNIANKLSFNQTQKHLDRLNIRLASYKELYDRGQIVPGNNLHSIWIKNDLESAIEKFEQEKSNADAKKIYGRKSVMDRIKSIASSGFLATATAALANYFEIWQPIKDIMIFSAVCFCTWRVAKAICDAWTESYEKCVKKLDEALKHLAADVQDIRLY